MRFQGDEFLLTDERKKQILVLFEWGFLSGLDIIRSIPYCYLSLLFSHWVVSDSLWPYGLQCTRPPCPSPPPGVFSNSCPLSQWYHPTISSSVTPFSSCPPSFPSSGSFPISQFFPSGGQSIRASASASVLPMNIQGWSPLGLAGLISLESKRVSRVFSSLTNQQHQFFGVPSSLWFNSVILVLTFIRN